MKCKICNSESSKIHNGKVLNKYDIEYFQCTNCGFVQTEMPYWLEESYSNAISISDTGVMSRNLMFSKISTIILSILVNKQGEFLDYGSGYGIFPRLMRDNGFDFYWYDKYDTNLLARGFEGKLRNKKYEAITSFENFEHFENPLEEIEKIFDLSDFVLFSTDLVSVPAPAINDWWYYCLEHGQHISLFALKSLEYLAERYGYFLTTNGINLHIFSKKRKYNNIFFFEKLIRKFRLETFFKNGSKTVSDMNLMIQKMRDL